MLTKRSPRISSEALRAEGGFGGLVSGAADESDCIPPRSDLQIFTHDMGTLDPFMGAPAIAAPIGWDAVEPVGGDPLGTANRLSPPPPLTINRYRALTDARRGLRDRNYHPLYQRGAVRRYVGPLLQGRGHSLGWCGLVLGAGRSEVSITEAGFKGVVRCGNPWCPVCGRKKARDLQQWLVKHVMPAAQARGWSTALVTLTVSHKIGDSAASVLDLLTRSRAMFWRRVAKDWLGREGSVDVLENTIGRHGWHFHDHSLMFTSIPLDDEKIARLQAAWSAAVADCGGSAQASDVGCKVDPLRQAPAGAPEALVAAYIAKAEGLAWEVAGEVHKRSRKASLTLADLVALSESSLDARALLAEGLGALQNKHRINTGRIAKTLGIMTLKQFSDDDDAAQTDDQREPDQQPAELAVIEIDDLRLVAARHTRCDLALVRVAIKHGQRGVDRVVGWVRRRQGLSVSDAAATRARIAEVLAKATAGPLYDEQDLSDYLRLIDAPRRAKKGPFAARVGLGHYDEMAAEWDRFFAAS